MSANTVWLMNLPKQVSDARERRGISLKKASDEIGLSSSSILWRFEKNQRATFDQIIKMALWAERQS